jgi:hypothetical protein
MIDCRQKNYWESTVESYYVELAEVSKNEVQVWRSCILVPQRTKTTSWEIYQEVVWSIHSIVLSTK